MDYPMTTGYHFTMLDQTGMRREGDTYTYTGLCDMELELRTRRSMMQLPHPRATRRVSWTLPRLEPTPPSTPAVSQSTIPTRAVRTEDVAGPSQPRPMWDHFEYFSEEESDMHYSDLVREDLEVEEEADDCVEVINIEDSVEIIDLVSESEMEEDPSEASSGWRF